MNIIDQNIKPVHALCQKYRVNKLFVFGSILTRSFKEESDIDLVVDFADVELYEYADNYFDFKFSLEKLLKRDVDLLENLAIKNPYLRKSIDSNKQLVYG